MDAKRIAEIKYRAENEMPSSFREDGALIQKLRADVFELVAKVEKLQTLATKWGQALLCLRNTAVLAREDHSPYAVLRDIEAMADEGFYQSYPAKESIVWEENLPTVEAALT